MKMLSVLSLGSTRGLWKGELDDDYQRLTGYSRWLERYHLISTSYHPDHLVRLRLSSALECIPTNSYGPADAFLKMIWLGVQEMRRQRFDLIQGQDPFFSGLAAALLGGWFRVPVNICVYGPNVYDANWQATHWSHRILAPLGRWVLKRVEGVQVDGQMTRDSLIRNQIPAEKISLKPVIPANLDDFLLLPEKCKEGGPLRLLTVGRLVRQKDLGVLIEAFGFLVNEGGWDLVLEIVGEGPERSGLESLVRERGLCSRVSWRGSLPRAQMPECFGRADIFVLSSRYEGFARVLMEAAAAAVPVVTTAVSGSAELIGAEEGDETEQGGKVVAIGNARALSAAVEELCQSETLRLQMGRAARTRVLRMLAPEERGAEQARIWQKIVERNTGGTEWRRTSNPERALE
jgi:glycosyltransferase involved in cell wall biosynthesis